MGSVVRVAIVYFFLVLLFRIAGRRTLTQLTSFDLILLLILSELTQQAMVSDDHSLTNALVAITTLIGLDIGLSLVKQRAPQIEKWIDGLPTVIIADGKLLTDRMVKARIDEADILAAARESQGLERLDQIKYAVLERSGCISIIPKDR